MKLFSFGSKAAAKLQQRQLAQAGHAAFDDRDVRDDEFAEQDQYS